MYDLVVVGGGPAGSSAAITAAREGASVLLLEKGSFPRQKVCGEFVSAESLELLSSLLSGSELMKDYRRIGKARVFVENRMLEMPVEPAAGSIGRVDLDAALWNAAKVQGVDAREQSKVDAISGAGPFVVSAGGSEFQSRSVIDASGRWSNISRREGNGHHSSGKWMGLKAHFRESRPSNSVDLYFFKGGYCGVQPVGISQGYINVCAMVRSDVSKSLPQTFAQHPELKRRSMSWEQASEVVATSPLIFNQPEPFRDSILRAGDAAGFVDPFVGDGISLALRGGALAANSLRGFLTGRNSLQQAAENYRETYSRQLAHVFSFSSRIRSLFAYPAPVRAAILYALVSFPALTRYMVRKTR